MACCRTGSRPTDTGSLMTRGGPPDRPGVQPSARWPRLRAARPKAILERGHGGFIQRRRLAAYRNRRLPCGYQHTPGGLAHGWSITERRTMEDFANQMRWLVDVA